ncbi:MerR family transcriptional regulator [Vibrio sp. HA2012]|uniref:MerR family transcriptional regulator n=1 Tax=Vibrio sp. HA2012 TaxID=1971595 RepID=UPI000C2CAC8D|nr:MerR family transcriptional regulator [Vibrio sp. HA2012]PJC86574.1 MerR family transcriptional regulator [Vibrio sp. HA2012]
MKTSELAKRAGVTAETVRFYTRKGLLTAARNPENDYKLYDQSALERLRFIYQARAIGFSLKEIEEIIQYSQQGNSPCPKVRQMLGKKIQETEKKIADLTVNLSMMRETFSEWANEPDMVPDGKAICCLIEEWSDKHDALPEEAEHEQP